MVKQHLFSTIRNHKRKTAASGAASVDHLGIEIYIVNLQGDTRRPGQHMKFMP